MIRLMLLCHGATAATRAAAFPLDESLEPRALDATRGLRGHFAAARVVSSPALRARQTAEALGLVAEIEPALRDQEAGDWAGLTPDRVFAQDAEGLTAFIADPHASAPGGESAADLVARVTAWLDGFNSGQADPGPGAVLAITHAAVIRAAVIHVLGAPLESLRRIDVPPLSTTGFVSDGRRWLWRAARERGTGAAG